MNTRHSRRITRKVAEELLDGSAGPADDQDHLARVLAAAAAPGHAAELGGNGVVGARYDATEVMQGVTEVLAYGTAVFVEAAK